MTATVSRFRDPNLGWYQEGYLDLPADLDYDAWAEVGRNLHRWERNVMWWLGDWWRYGEHRYGESAAHAAPTGYSVKTCQEAARVATKVEPPRRIGSLPWAHHQAVAAREPAQQDAILAEAAERHWPVEQVRARVRHLRCLEDAVDPDAYSWQWVCATCDDDGPHFDCPRPTDASFDRGAVCAWLFDHRRHDVRFLGQEQISERAQ